MNTPNTSNSLASRALLANLTVHTWTAKKRDAEISREIAQQKGTSIEAGDYHKRLLAGKPVPYEAILTAGRAVYNLHRSQTLPWLDDGTRILPAANFAHYGDIIRPAIRNFDDTVSAFMPIYPELIEASKRFLNGMWKEEDYPSAEEVKRRFRIEILTLPIPDAGDFRSEIIDALGASQVRRMSDEIEARLQQTAQAGMQEIWQRLYEAVSRMQERLSDPQHVYRDSLFGNLADLCDLLPRLNLTDDPRLDQMTADVRAKLLVCSAQTAREDKNQRAQIAREAQQIQDAMAAFYTPAQG